MRSIRRASDQSLGTPKSASVGSCRRKRSDPWKTDPCRPIAWRRWEPRDERIRVVVGALVVGIVPASGEPPTVADPIVGHPLDHLEETMEAAGGVLDVAVEPLRRLGHRR